MAFPGSLNPFLTAFSKSAAVHCPGAAGVAWWFFLGSLNPFELLPRIPPFGEGLQSGSAKPLAEASCHVCAIVAAHAACSAVLNSVASATAWSSAAIEAVNAAISSLSVAIASVT